MGNSNKIWQGWLAFFFVVLHFLTIVIYALPVGYVSEPIKNTASAYVYPVFEQSWALFAPAPLLEQTMLVKYHFDGDSTDWLNPMKASEEFDQSFRGTYHGDLALGQANLLYYITSDIETMGMSFYEDFPPDSLNTFQRMSSYWMLNRYLYGTSYYLFEKRPLSAHVRCFAKNVQTGEEGEMLLPEFTWKNNP